MDFRIAGLAAGLTLAMGTALAQEHDHAAMMAAAPAAAEASSTKAFRQADAKMHKAMAATAYTGDADVDFLRGMIPHHQGAIDTAKIVLQYGTDPEVRMLAGDIIKAQEAEIRTMKAWLEKHGPQDAMETMTDGTGAEPMAAAVTKPLAVSASNLLPVSATVPVSGTLQVTPSMPPVDRISPTTAAITMDEMLAMPLAMPAPGEEIPHEAPKMEFLDGPAE